MAYNPEVSDARPWFAAKLRQALTNDDVVPAIMSEGGTTIPAGTLLETLQALADLADPA